MAQISIIIPCYNVEKYIDRCLDSLVNQTIGLANLQIIVVNDASTDGTLAKLAEWEQRYPKNIVLITYDENIRQGGARNRGLEIAEGKYIGFVDSDDFVELDMYEQLYEKALETDADVVRCKYVRDNGDGDIILNPNEQKDAYYTFEKRGDYFVHKVSDVGNNGEYGGVTVGIVKSELISENHLTFPEKLRYEDNYWGEILGLYQKDLYIIDRVLYHYWVNEESTILKRNDTAILDKLTIEVLILEEYKKMGAYQYFEDHLFWGFIGRAYAGFLYHIFLRCDRIIVDINDLKKYIGACFPDYRERIDVDISAEAEENRILFEVLASDKEYTKAEQEEIRERYLTAMARTRGLI